MPVSATLHPHNDEEFLPGMKSIPFFASFFRNPDWWKSLRNSSHGTLWKIFHPREFMTSKFLGFNQLGILSNDWKYSTSLNPGLGCRTSKKWQCFEVFLEDQLTAHFSESYFLIPNHHVLTCFIPDVRDNNSGTRTVWHKVFGASKLVTGPS